MKTPSLPGISPLTPIEDVAGHHAFTGTSDGREVVVIIAKEAGAARNPKTLARLGTHPHVARVVTSGTLDGRRFAVLKAPASSAHESLGRVSGAEAVRWTIEIAEALKAAHGADVIHGAIDPTTIGIDGTRSACLLGFKLVSDAPPAPVSPYTPPEATAGYGYPSKAGDVFSLAATLFEFLTRRRPDPSASHHELSQALDDPGIPPTIAAVVRAALSTDPTHRPSADLFHTQLSAALKALERVHEDELRAQAAVAAEAEAMAPDAPGPDTRSEQRDTDRRGPDIDRPDAVTGVGASPAVDHAEPRSDAAPAIDLAAAPRPDADVETDRGQSTETDPNDTADDLPARAPAHASAFSTAAVPSQQQPSIRPAPVPRHRAEPDGVVVTVDRPGAPEWLAPALWIAAAICLAFAVQIALVARLLG